MLRIMDNSIRVPVWQNEGTSMGSTDSVFVPDRDTCVLRKGGEAVYGLDVVLVGRTLFDGS